MNIKVRPEELTQISHKLERTERKVSGYRERLLSVRNHCDRGGEAMKRVIRSLNYIAGEMEETGNLVHTMREGLEGIREQYQGCESRLSDLKTGKTLAELLFPGPVDKRALEMLYDKETREEAKKERSKKFSLLNGKAAADGTIGETEVHGEAEGELLGASWNGKVTSGIKWKDEKAEDGTITRKLSGATLLSASLAGDAYLAKGSVKGNVGLLYGKASGTVGKVSGKGEIDVSLIKDGRLAPQLSAKAEASATALEGKAEVGVGTENNNIFVKADGKAGYAKAEAGLGIGTITTKTADGREKTALGVEAKAGAEAYAAQGTVSGGIRIMGVTIDVGVTGKAGGAGAKVGGSVTTGGVSGSLSIGALIGLGVDFKIDWSGFKWGW